MIRSHMLTVIGASLPRPRDLAAAAHIAPPQPEGPFIGRRDAEPQKCAAGNGNGENGNHWSAIGFGRWGQTDYQHRPISIARNSKQNAEVLA
jgi:hypothetical protein